MRRHKPKRRWWAPWKTRCSCGCGWWPCPDTFRIELAPIADTAAVDHGWNGPTAYHVSPKAVSRPLMTRGQQWRSQTKGGGHGGW